MISSFCRWTANALEFPRRSVEELHSTGLPARSWLCGQQRFAAEFSECTCIDYSKSLLILPIFFEEGKLLFQYRRRQSLKEGLIEIDKRPAICFRGGRCMQSRNDLRSFDLVHAANLLRVYQIPSN